MKNKAKKYESKLLRNIINNTLDASAWSFSLLFLLGEATVEAFLNPSYYADLPSGEVDFIDTKEVKKKKMKEITIRQSIRRLQKHGFVKREEGKILLTKKGKSAVDYILKRKKSLNKKWDKKYRVVIFDIPEKKRRDRDWLRKELYLLKYKQLQKSVFVSKHPLTKDIIDDIKKRKINNCVDYILADKIYSKF